MLLAPLLARFKTRRAPKTSGDKIGGRRLDTHFLGLPKAQCRFSVY